MVSNRIKNGIYQNVAGSKSWSNVKSNAVLDKSRDDENRQKRVVVSVDLIGLIS